MMVLLKALGFGLGTVHMTIWLAVRVVGIPLIVLKRRIARAGMKHPGLL
jgi:hypothetical protein